MYACVYIYIYIHELAISRMEPTKWRLTRRSPFLHKNHSQPCITYTPRSIVYQMLLVLCFVLFCSIVKLLTCIYAFTSVEWMHVLEWRSLPVPIEEAYVKTTVHSTEIIVRHESHDPLVVHRLCARKIHTCALLSRPGLGVEFF